MDSASDSGRKTRQRPAVLFAGIASVAVVLFVAFLGYAYTQPVSRIHVMAYVGSEYGDMEVTIYLDEEFKAEKNVSWSSGAYDETFKAVPGKHTIRADWSIPVDGETNETMILELRPFSTGRAFFLHGVGLV